MADSYPQSAVEAACEAAHAKTGEILAAGKIAFGSNSEMVATSLDAALSVCPVLGLTEEETRAVLMAMIFGSPDEPHDVLEEAKRKLRLTASAWRSVTKGDDDE